ncbi:Uma2 family endonuclease [Streptomyces sp. NPDC054863]
MSVTEERSGVLTQDFFEGLARDAVRRDEFVRLEFVNGKIGVKTLPDGNHASIIAWLTRVCIQADPAWWLFPEQGIHVETYRKGNARPDGSLAPMKAFAGQGEWAEPDEVLMTVEVTSRDSDTNQCDRIDKPRAYAEADIPVYLLIDRDSHEVKVHSEPGNGQYRQVRTVPFGETVLLPDPVGIELDTEPLKSWVD